jgi:hypothetical protein
MCHTYGEIEGRSGLAGALQSCESARKQICFTAYEFLIYRRGIESVTCSCNGSNVSVSAGTQTVPKHFKVFLSLSKRMSEQQLEIR